MIYFLFKCVQFSLLVAQDEQEHVAGRTNEIHLTSANQVLPTIEYDNEVQMGTNLWMHSPPFCELSTCL